MPPKRRRRFQGLYYHSSPPKVLPMNDQIANSNGRRKRDTDDLSVKLSTIRIWMHEKDIGKLTRVLWAGQGNRLRQQASTNGKVKRFLAAVPYVMNSIKEVHQAVIDNSLETLQAKLEPPVPPALVTCRDANGLNLIHKAAGLGHATILEYLIATWPNGVHEIDITGKTPLHWAASAKNNMRCYTLLTQAGCDEEAVDYKMKTPSYYRHKPNEIERAFLTYVPEAPRVSPDVTTDWDALSDNSGDGKKLDIKIPEMNGFGRHSIAESNENTSEADTTDTAHEDVEGVPATEEPAEEKPEEQEAETETVEHSEQQSDKEEEEEEQVAKQEEEKPEIDITDAKDEEADDEEAEEVEMLDTEKAADDEEQTEKQPTENHNERTATENLIKESEVIEANEINNEQEIEDNNEKETDGKNTDDLTEELQVRNEEIKIAEEQSKAASVLDDLNKKQANKDKEEMAHEKEPKKQENDKNLKEHKPIEDPSTNETSETHESEMEKEIQDKEEIEKNLEPAQESSENNQETTNKEQETESPEKEDQSNIKAIGNALVTIKEEVKENVEFLANQIKNVFSDNDDKKEENGQENVTKEQEKEIDSGELKQEKVNGEHEQNKSSEQHEQEQANDKHEQQKISAEHDKEKAFAKKEKEKVSEEQEKDKVSGLQEEEKISGAHKQKKATGEHEQANVNAEHEQKKATGEDKQEKVNREHEQTKATGEHEQVKVNGDREQNVPASEHEQKKAADEEEKINMKLEVKQEIQENEIQSTPELKINTTTTTTHIKDQEQANGNKLNSSSNKISENTNENPEILLKQNEKTQSTAAEFGDTKNADSSTLNTSATPITTKLTFSILNENTSTNSITQNVTPEASPTKVTPQTEKDKTEEQHEDENNNSNSSTSKLSEKNSSDATHNLTKVKTTEAITDEQFKELEMSLENFKNSKENEDKEKIQDNLKENVQEMNNKIKKVPRVDNLEELDQEDNDVVVYGERKQKQVSGKGKLVKNDESSDDTADEDEEPQTEADNEENNNIIEENKETGDEELIENESEPEPAEEPHSPENADEVLHHNKGDSDLKLDSNEGHNAEGSPSSSLAIEGFVQGDAEDNTVQSQTAAYNQDDEETRLQNVIASGDMEQLAQIVLNGDGQKLMNVQSTDPEIQAFLNNVPNYMNKIRRVHEAARNGSLLNLQQSLDRRKFAIAKDESSPQGASPLHVAVLFGNSDIVRYLSARFSETMIITDNDGRTALHYAAVVNDNGHFYNVLLQLGANPKTVDKMGYTPEDYLANEELNDILNYGQLLKRFGAEDLEEQLLSDQGQIENQSVQENPIFKTEQSKYLADNFVDPLIKALRQIAHKRPNDPLQYLTNYLQNYMTAHNKNGRTITQVAIHSGSSHTSSTALASSKHETPPSTQLQNNATRMNGQLKYNNADNIEEDSIQQLEGYDGDDDEGSNDSDAAMSKKLEERDDHGQSMLHFACARSHRKGGLIHLIEDAKADITHRDELYRTARDVALQANQIGNAKEIDRYVMSLAIVGEIKPFEHFALSGYDHIIDVLDENDTPIIKVVEGRGLYELSAYLKAIRPLEELREEMHQMIRDNNVGRVKEITNGPNGKWLIKAKNYYGRTALHIAILKESEELVEHFVNLCPQVLKIGDNLERTPLHYAMGTNIIESISRVLIQNGAKRTYKDLKGRQPSYYFMNKADILRLQEEEDESR